MHDAATSDVNRGGGGVDSVRVVVWATAVLLALMVIELFTHQARDSRSYDAGYRAASQVADAASVAAGRQPGVAICEVLFERVTYTAGYPAIVQRDFRAGCTQAVRDAHE